MGCNASHSRKKKVLPVQKTLGAITTVTPVTNKEAINLGMRKCICRTSKKRKETIFFGPFGNVVGKRIIMKRKSSNFYICSYPLLFRVVLKNKSPPYWKKKLINNTCLFVCLFVCCSPTAHSSLTLVSSFPLMYIFLCFTDYWNVPPLT